MIRSWGARSIDSIWRVTRIWSTGLPTSTRGSRGFSCSGSITSSRHGVLNLTEQTTRIRDGIRCPYGISPIRDVGINAAKTKRSVRGSVCVLAGFINFFFAQIAEGKMTLKSIVHEIRIQNQVIFLDPPIEYARSTWIRQLHDWLGTSGPHLLPPLILPVHRIPCRRCLSPATNTKFTLRDWIAVTERADVGNDVHVISAYCSVISQAII